MAMQQPQWTCVEGIANRVWGLGLGERGFLRFFECPSPRVLEVLEFRRQV